MSSITIDSLVMSPSTLEQGSTPTTVDGEKEILSQPTISTLKKALIVGIVSWISLCTCFGSASLFPATDVISKEFSTSSEMLDISNAVTLLSMGCSSFLWLPISTIIGSRAAYNLATLLLMVFCVGTALAPSIQVFIAMRLLAGFEGTWFLVGGQDLIASMFVPTQRGTAVGFFLAGTVLGPALGPCVGGIVVTYTSWRVIFWIQAGMTAVGLIFALVFLPPLDIDMRRSTTGTRGKRSSLAYALKSFNPYLTLRMLLVPRVFLNNLTCAFLSWTVYSLLASPHYVLSEALNLDTPILGGLFYLAPGSGFLTGTLFGGRYADIIVKKYIRKRGGERRPEDRLNSALLILICLTPASLLAYGWTAQYRSTGIVVPAISAFLAGFGIMAAFAALNTYAVECAPEHRKQVVVGKYLVQYSFSSAASGATIPLIDRIALGPTMTLSATIVFIGGLLTFTLIRCESGDNSHHSKARFETRESGLSFVMSSQ